MKNTLYKSIAIVLCCVFAVFTVSCSNFNATDNDNSLIYDAEDLPSFERSAVDFSQVTFNQWDVESASANIKTRAAKPYTIMVYMNGSDLESYSGAATIDLIEMLESGLKSENANIIVLTGGAKRWLNNVIPSNTCALWEIADGQIFKLADIGLRNMGDPGTLSSFINFSIKNFTAEKYGLIFWDHGGGSIAGFGSDEKFNNSNLTLLDLNCAFEKSELKNIKLEFIGFDACLMAAVEMGVVASNYANYLIASEDLEPGDGWDYSFLAELNNNPHMSGAEIGKEITDYFFKFYGSNYYSDLTLSVIDLNYINKVMYAMGELMSACSESLNQNQPLTFSDLSQKRYATKTFGGSNPLSNVIDMVDIGDMAEKLKNAYPEQTGKVLSAIKSCVVYNKHNSDANLSGLSTYYVYGGKSTGKQSLNLYSDLKMDNYYTGYLHNFFNILTNATARTSIRSGFSSGKDTIRTDIAFWKQLSAAEDFYIMTGIIKCGEDTIKNELQTENVLDDLKIPKINGIPVCLFEIDSSFKGTLYSVPIELNGEDAELIILENKKHPEGKILGYRICQGFKIQKGFNKFKNDDKIAFYYMKKDFKTNSALDENKANWYKSNIYVLNDEINIDWVSCAEENDYFCLIDTDIYNNKSYGDLIQTNKTQKQKAA